MSRSSGAKILRFQEKTKPLRHERSAKKRKEERRKTREWSATRPKPPESIDVFDQLMLEAKKKFHGASRFQQADTTGLSISTVSNHLRNLVDNPNSRSLVMWARALGGRLVFVKDE